MLSQPASEFSRRVAVIGGGIAGSTTALALAEQGLDVTLFERKSGLVSGPPICHLHAGGNLYREISQQQCITLLRQSIDSVKAFPHTFNHRPTIIAVPCSDPGSPQAIVSRLDAIRSAYQSLVEQDSSNKVLGEPQAYYQLYTREALEALAKKPQPVRPQTNDDWVIPFACFSDLDKLRYPVVVVQEHGWSIFRLAATLTLALERNRHCTVRTGTGVESVLAKGEGWQVAYTSEGSSVTEEFDFLVNACGFETGTVDDWANKPRKRLVEFKAAYVTRWPENKMQWPEVIFHGPRGTPQGMAQFTPYPGGVFQLHGMTHDITLFEGGLVASDSVSAQPVLPPLLLNKVKKGWLPDQQQERTSRAIKHMGQFIPEFGGAEVAGKPLYGAQQIPGDDVTLRAADLSFCGDNYARLEVVKGSSVIDAAKGILAHLKNHGWPVCDDRVLETAAVLSRDEVGDKAVELAHERGYPQELAEYID